MSERLEAFGVRCQQARVRAGISQTVAADRVGLVRSSIANIEAGRQDTTMSTVLALADLYGVPVGFLVGEVDLTSPVFGPEVAAMVRAAVASSGRSLTEFAVAARLSRTKLEFIMAGKVWPLPDVIDRILAVAGVQVVVSSVPIRR